MDRNKSRPAGILSGTVALLTEGVDRNRYTMMAEALQSIVALLTEGVDRNFRPRTSPMSATVALLTEGVDRNCILERI